MAPFENSSTVCYSPSVVNLPIFYRFGDKARYWSKIAIFHTPLHSTPPLGWFPSEYCYSVWCGRTILLPDGEKNFDDMFSRFDRISACDRLTDILPRHSPHYAYASRDKNRCKAEILQAAFHYSSQLQTWSTRSSAIADKPFVLVCKVIEVWQDYLSEYVDKKFTYYATDG